MIYNNKRFPKIHQLDIFLELCFKIDKEFLKIKEEIFYLRSFYFETRYPGDYPEFNRQEAKQAYESAKIIKKFVLNKIKF